MASFPNGIIKISFNGETRLAEYMGRQRGVECVICGKGDNAHTFNLFDNEEAYKRAEYETIGFGTEHFHN